MKNRIIPYLIFLVIAGFFSCTKIEEPIFDNPIDPLNPNREIPCAEITQGISNGATINSTTVIINWKGICSGGKFAYKLDNVDSQFSDWTASTEVFYNYLNEGTYTFYVKEKSKTGIEQKEVTATTFTVDAVTKCGLVLNKMYTHASSFNNFFIDLNIENVTNIKGFTTSLNFDKTCMQLYEINILDGLFYENSDNEAFITNTIEEANNSGVIEINLLLLGGTNSNFSGNAPVCRMIFNATSAKQTNINFIESKTDLRDYNNNNIICNILRGGIVDIN